MNRIEGCGLLEEGGGGGVSGGLGTLFNLHLNKQY